MSGTLSTLVTYNWNPSTQLRNLLVAEAGVESGSGSGATIAFLGDSTTDGFGTAPSNYIATTSLPAQVTAALQADGVTANQADFMGQGNELAYVTDARVSLFGGASWTFPLAAGGEPVGLSQAGAGVSFAPGSNAPSKSLTLDYIDQGGATLAVSVNGQSIGTVTTGNSGLLSAATLNLPVSEVVTNVTVTDTNGNPAYLEGLTLASTAPSIQVVDDGVGGAASSIVGAGTLATNPYNVNAINSVAEQNPTVAFVNFGINDVLQGSLTAAQTTANLQLIVQELQAVGTEPVIVIPNPITGSAWAAEIGTLRADVDALAVQLNVGVIDLSATSGDNAAALLSAGLLGSDGVHPTAAYDAQVAKQLAALLTQSAPSSTVTVTTTPPATVVTTPPATGTDTTTTTPPATVTVTPPPATVTDTTTPPATVTVTPTPPAAVTVTAPVTTPDTLVLGVSEDAWQGDAQFTVAINGTTIAGVYTATASHSAGATQDISITGNWGTGIASIGVTFINDAYAGTPDTDRNLYVNQVTYDGQDAMGAPATLLSNGTSNFTLPTTSAPATPITVHLAEDAWNGDAQYSIAVDGQPLTQGGAVTASNALGQSQAINLQAALSAGTHDLAVSFLNDAYGGTPSTDRNLYVTGIDVNGAALAGGTATLLSTGTSHFQIVIPSS